MAVTSTTVKMIIILKVISRIKTPMTSVKYTTTTSITKVKDTNGNEMAMAATPVSLKSIATARNSTSKVTMAAKTSATITSTTATKETALRIPPRTQKIKSITQNNILLK